MKHKSFVSPTGPCARAIWCTFYLRLPILHCPVDSSQKPSRVRNLVEGPLSSGADGDPYAGLRLLPHPRLLRVSIPVTGLIPLAYLHNSCTPRPLPQVMPANLVNGVQPWLPATMLSCSGKKIIAPSNITCKADTTSDLRNRASRKNIGPQCLELPSPVFAAGRSPSR